MDWGIAALIVCGCLAWILAGALEAAEEWLRSRRGRDE